MAGFNWIDLIILGLLVVGIIKGRQVGFLIQLCVIGGFFSGLFFAGWLFPHILPIHDRTLLTLVNVNLVLLFAALVATRGFDVAERIHFSLPVGKLKSIESTTGILLSTIATLVLVWLLAAMIGRLPFAGLSNSANDAYIVQFLDRHLPPVPAVFAEFNRIVHPNSQPMVFFRSHNQISLVTSPMLSPPLQTAAAADEAAVVRITSFGCGGIVEGSGFVAAPNVIMTNAHVIAGVRRPIVKTSSRSYEAVPILFNPNLDLAFLRVQGLQTSPLELSDKPLAPNTATALLGYPLGNYASIAGIVRDEMQVFGPNIYDVGTIGRDVYEVQASIDHGNSGGPMVTTDGQVQGVVFAKSASSDDYGYAISSPNLISSLHRVEKSNRRVSTGVCLAG